ncbi:MAG TPA: hypothetical protein VFL83_02315 [Anaeromyxobacter sp.]|nr:hypothetical protein [Anaeromyxobacter sp.]
MTPLRAVLAAATLAALAAARPASAHGPELGLGADWLVDPDSGELQLTLGVATHLARNVDLGVRFGVAWFDEADVVGVPIDGRLRIRTGRLYLEGLVGPWILFDSGDSVQLHAAIGFGLQSRSLSFGLEVGVLEDTSMVGVRVAFPL